MLQQARLYFLVLIDFSQYYLILFIRNYDKRFFIDSVTSDAVPDIEVERIK